MQAKKIGYTSTRPKTDFAKSLNTSLPQEFLMFHQYCMSLYRRNFNRRNLWKLYINVIINCKSKEFIKHHGPTLTGPVKAHLAIFHAKREFALRISNCAQSRLTYIKAHAFSDIEVKITYKPLHYKNLSR
jgi:hypothetical protein